MLNFGSGELTFAGRQMRLDVGGEEFFIDLLFFHVGLLRWVIVDERQSSSHSTDGRIETGTLRAAP